jgi:hypothetical protein
MLANWPQEDRSALDWDDAASAIQARIEAGSKADETGEITSYMTDEEIFSPPAGQTDKDGHNSPSPLQGSLQNEPGRVNASGAAGVAGVTDAKGPVTVKSAAVPEESKMSLTHEQRERDRKSLQDLARLAQMTPAPSSVRMPAAVTAPAPSKPASSEDMLPSSRKEEDSGLVNFAAFSPSSPSSSPSVPSSVPQMPGSMRGVDQVVGAAAPLSVPPSFAPPARVSAPAQAGLFDDEPLSGHPPSVAPISAAPVSLPPGFVATLPSGGVPQVGASVHPQVVIASAVANNSANNSTSKKGGAAIYMIGAVVALAAVAAGGFFVVRPMMLKSQQAAAAAQAAKVETKVEATAPVVPETRWQDQIAAAKPSDVTPPPAVDEKAVELADNTPAAAPKAGGAGGVAAKKPSAPAGKDNKSAALFAQNDDTKVAPPPPAPPVADAKKAAPVAGNGTGLEDAMKTAAGPSDSTNVQTADEKKPAFAPGTVPQRPSQGAVTGAIGAVLSNARACLGEDDAVSRATITFNGSDGKVASVTVRGGAAGKPAEACIKGALSAAKVPPFAEATYSAPVNVRH